MQNNHNDYIIPTETNLNCGSRQKKNKLFDNLFFLIQFVNIESRQTFATLTHTVGWAHPNDTRTGPGWEIVDVFN